MFLNPQEHFRIVVPRSIRILLPRQRQYHSRILLAYRRKLIRSISSRDLDEGPLPPQVDSSSGLDHLIDVSASDARRTLQKIEMPVGMRLNEFRMRHAAHQPQSRNQ